jgi:N-methylhydantoinase A
VHDRRFGHRSGGPTEIVKFKVAAIGLVGKPTLPAWRGGARLQDALVGRRSVYFDGAFVDVAVYHRDRLPRGQIVEGPTVIEESGSTTILPRGWRAQVLDRGDLLLTGSKP